jgi:fructose-bisphosphate aldolase class I
VNTLRDTARKLVASGKGLEAMDESDATCAQRFAAAGIPQTVEARRGSNLGYMRLLVDRGGTDDATVTF